MKVALYGRISTTKQEVENQLIKLRDFCKKEGWEIYKEYIDTGISGSQDIKPKYEELLIDAYKKEFDLVFFWSLDRLSREGTLPTLIKLNHLNSIGINWKSYTEPYIDSSGMFKDVVISLLSTLAKQEKIRISERTKSAYDRKRKIAKEKGHKLNWGRKEKRIDKALIIKLRFEEGLSLRKIAEIVGCSYGTVNNLLKNI